MRLGEKGFTLLELLVAITIIVVASSAAGGAIFQVIRNTQHNNDRMTVVRQVENAGYWISRDVQMAQSVNATDNMTLLIASWTEWDAAGNPTYHSVTYYFDDVTDGVGKLKRNHQIYGGTEEYTQIAEYIYYDPDDADNTSIVSYESPVVTVKLTARYEQMMESKEYTIRRRPNL